METSQILFLCCRFGESFSSVIMVLLRKGFKNDEYIEPFERLVACLYEGEGKEE